MSTMAITLAIIGGLIIVILGVVAGRLLAQLRQQTLKQQKNRQAYIDNTIDSIQLIAKAVVQGQCELSEGSIRLCVLLERLESSDASARYPATHELYRRIRHMPTHEARKALDKKERRMLDKERLEHEKELEDALLKEAELLQTFSV